MKCVILKQTDYIQLDFSTACLYNLINNVYFT